ncbi:glycyl radical enzyme domain-containing protein, partial [Clostridium perfringens]
MSSCYNGFNIGGCGYTLVRIKLNEVAKKATSVEDFLETVLPYVSTKMIQYIDERIRFLVEDTQFFTSNFLVKEGFIQ